MMEKLKASILSALYGPNRSIFKEWRYAKWTDSAVTLSNDIDAYKFALYL